MGRSWSDYRLGYRKREAQILGGWIQSGISGTVVGLPGIGKSNLLGFLSHRPDVLNQYLPDEARKIAVIQVDLNNLPANDTSTLYRVILRSFYEFRQYFDPQLRQLVTTVYLENRAASDPFLPHSALRELILGFQEQQVRVYLFLDRFDRFCQEVEPKMVDTLRGLRDSFKDTVGYIAGMRQQVGYLSDPAVLGDLYELLDTYICWVQPIAEADALQLVHDETDHHLESLSANEIRRILELAGSNPALLKAICHWWVTTTKPAELDWLKELLAQPSIVHRLEKIWRSLTLAEQQVLGQVQMWQSRRVPPAEKPGENRQPEKELELDKNERRAFRLLRDKGLIEPAGHGWQIRGTLLTAFVADKAGQSLGALWLDEPADMVHQGRVALTQLTPLEHGLLRFLISHPRVRHTHTELIESVWPENTIREGVSTEALYQVVRGLRRKIEPEPARPHYIINWRGTPEGGYQCFPQGRPG